MAITAGQSHEPFIKVKDSLNTILIIVIICTNINSKNFRCPCGYNCDVLKQVTVSVDHFYIELHYTNKYVIRLHPSLCVTQLQNQKGNRYACGLITLQFAEKMMNANQHSIYTHHMPNLSLLLVEVYAILLLSIKEGNSIYEANYKDEKKCLSAEDIILLSGDLQIHFKDEFEVVDELTYDMLALYIMSLEFDQILLLIRMTDYNVWSVIRRRRADIAIYDSQSHSILDQATGERKEFGGVIYFVLRTYRTVMQTLRLMELNSGLLEGLCKIGIIKRQGDTHKSAPV